MNETKNYSITKSGAVILEGGANRGVFTAGALDFLMEQEYYIPHVIGVSAGACCCSRRGQPLTSTIRITPS